jgi:hypothetical protein
MESASDIFSRHQRKPERLAGSQSGESSFGLTSLLVGETQLRDSPFDKSVPLPGSRQHRNLEVPQKRCPQNIPLTES